MYVFYTVGLVEVLTECLFTPSFTRFARSFSRSQDISKGMFVSVLFEHRARSSLGVSRLV